MSADYTSSLIVAVPVQITDLMVQTGTQRICQQNHVASDKKSKYCAECGNAFISTTMQIPTAEYQAYMVEHYMDDHYATYANHSEFFTDKTHPISPHLVCLNILCEYRCEHKLGFGVRIATTSEHAREVKHKSESPHLTTLDELEFALEKVELVAKQLKLKVYEPVLVVQQYCSY